MLSFCWIFIICQAHKKKQVITTFYEYFFLNLFIVLKYRKIVTIHGTHAHTFYLFSNCFPFSDFFLSMCGLWFELLRSKRVCLCVCCCFFCCCFNSFYFRSFNYSLSLSFSLLLFNFNRLFVFFFLSVSHFHSYIRYNIVTFIWLHSYSARRMIFFFSTNKHTHTLDLYTSKLDIFFFAGILKKKQKLYFTRYLFA